MASTATQQALVVLTTWPTQAPAPANAASDPNFATNTVFRPGGGNAVNVAGQVASGSGSLYLLRHWGSGLWLPVDLDSSGAQAISVNAALPADLSAGYFSATYATGDLQRSSTAEFCVVSSSNTMTFTANSTFFAARAV